MNGRSVRYLIAVALMQGILGCNSTSRPVSHFANERFRIPQDQLPGTIRAAESGDAAASYRLYLYYESVAIDEEKALHFLRMSAKTGNLKARYALGVTLLRSDKIDERNEAAAILKSAAAAGSKEAAEVLQLYHLGN